MRAKATEEDKAKAEKWWEIVKDFHGGKIAAVNWYATCIAVEREHLKLTKRLEKIKAVIDDQP
jgi:hypothetical protein